MALVLAVSAVLVLLLHATAAALPLTIVVHPEENLHNASAVISAVVRLTSLGERECAFEVNWSWDYQMDACATDLNPLLPLFDSATNRSTGLKVELKPVGGNDTSNIDTVDVFASDANGNTTHATVTLCRDTHPLRLKIRTNMSALRLLLPDLKMSRDNEIQLEMRLDLNDSTQNIGELLKKYGDASFFNNHSVEIGVNVSDIMRVFLGSGDTVHGSISFIEDSVSFTLKEVSQRDTTPPEIEVLSPSEGQKFASPLVSVSVSASEPIRRWYYRLNNGTETELESELCTSAYSASSDSPHSCSLSFTVNATEGINRLDVYADDLVGNRGKAAISFVVMNPLIATESSIEGEGSISIERGISSGAASIESKEQIEGITGTDGNYSIVSTEILSNPSKLTSQDYPDYHHAEVISFRGNELRLTRENSATKNGINITFKEDTSVITLQKHTTLDITTTSDNPEISYNTEVKDVFIGNKATKVDISTSTKKISIQHSLEGNCTTRMKLTFEE